MTHINSNPVGARNAIDVLAGFQGGKRVLVTPGMVELGDIEEEGNFMLGEHIGTSGNRAGYSGRAKKADENPFRTDCGRRGIPKKKKP